MNKELPPDPYFGKLTFYAAYEWIETEPQNVPCMGHKPCVFAFSSDAQASLPEDIENYRNAVRNFMTCTDKLWTDCTPEMMRYKEDYESEWEPDEADKIELEKPADIWRHVTLGVGYDGKPARLGLSRSWNPSDESIYISIEGSCAWEPEHGVQIVIKDGLRVNKLGPYDGHVTQSDAYDMPHLENVIYPTESDLEEDS